MLAPITGRKVKMVKKASIRQTRYDKTHCRTYGLKLNNVIDADVIEKLASVPSMQGYIKQLIRDDIARTKAEEPKTLGEELADEIIRKCF